MNDDKQRQIRNCNIAATCLFSIAAMLLIHTVYGMHQSRLFPWQQKTEVRR